jgi:leucyl aminopeptidase
MSDVLLTQHPEGAVPLDIVFENNFKIWLAEQQATTQRWLQSSGFQAKSNTYCLIPDTEHRLARVIVGAREDDIWALGDLPTRLPQGVYYLASEHPTESLERLALGWALGAYQFNRYKQGATLATQLVLPAACDLASVQSQASAISLVRDLINTGAEDMMPEHLAAVTEAMAERFGADFRQVVGDELLTQNYPTVHAVGRASSHAPRLLDLRWGDPAHPKVTLVGKGVCFDSGGLDIKSASGMRLMKKDMGGAAHVLGLAQAIMETNLPLRLRVLVPAVENAIAGNAFRPGDVIRTRQGLTVEIDNTDAEGRLVLCDALSEAVAEAPDLLIDFATLTGAARVAVGTDMPAYFCSERKLASALLAQSEREQDPIWQLPLHRPYRELLNSKVADIANSSSGGYAGAITAALFLQEFVPTGQAWTHFDLMAWNTRSRRGRPEGGEAMGLRTVYAYLRQWAEAG